MNKITKVLFAALAVMLIVSCAQTVNGVKPNGSGGGSGSSTKVVLNEAEKKIEGKTFASTGGSESYVFNKNKTGTMANSKSVRAVEAGKFDWSATAGSGSNINITITQNGNTTEARCIESGGKIILIINGKRFNESVTSSGTTTGGNTGSTSTGSGTNSGSSSGSSDSGSSSGGNPDVSTGIGFVRNEMNVIQGQTINLYDYLELSGVSNKDVTFTLSSIESRNGAPVAGGAYTSALMALGQGSTFDTKGTIHPVGDDPNLIYTIAVTSKENSSYKSEIKLTLVASSGNTFTEINSGAAPKVGDTFVIRNRLGGANTPWYAICIKDNNQIGFGYCSVKRSNAVRLARGTMSPSGGSDAKTRNYTLQNDQYCLNEGVKALGAGANDCKFVIQGDKLLYYFIGTVEFEKVAADKIDLD